MQAQVFKINKKEFVAKGEAVYERLRKKLEKKYHGKVAVIEVDSGDYFLGDTLIEADTKAKAKHPDKVFYAVKIGYPALYSFKR
ncbi:MAG: hypothetical protein ONB44_21135 [candidate division KSB1 bacterium]|nr:hypothetical protein [candidate division KSB1 bacterium]MDZ7304639.1 hypothetical protein [candidate division KSB1 bacterium]MDZ7313771.1 hypothetical protein [candidate division KSB1 bacterium]